MKKGIYTVEKKDSLFIAGNGFDIAHGIPSKYSEFRKYLIKKYPEVLKFRDEKIYMEDFDYLTPEEFAAEILLSTMDKVDGENWENFEAALAHIDFSNKFPVPRNNENETEEHDVFMRDYLLYMDKLSSGFIACTKCWQMFFQQWIREVEIPIKICNYSGKNSLKELFQGNNMLFFSFNYTKTLEKIYGIKDVTHIHNYVGQKLVFGHGEDDAKYEESSNDFSLSSSFLDDMVMSFRKDTNFPMIKCKRFFKMLNPNIDKVYSYGFSYGKVDGVYIKRIINSISPDTKWYFTEFEAKDSETLRIKKIKLRNYGFKGTFDIYEG